MKYLKEFINEAFDRKVPYEVDIQKPDIFVTSAIIGDREIQFYATQDSIDKNKNVTWEIIFYEIDSTTHKRLVNKTGNGDELAVFSMIKLSMEEFIKIYNPYKILFSASESNRANLYSRLTKRYVNNYVIKQSKSSGEVKFTLTRKT